MSEKLWDIRELLDQMVYDGTNETAPEVYLELQEEHKQLSGVYYNNIGLNLELLKTTIKENHAEIVEEFQKIIKLVRDYNEENPM